ncbi:uncharacterized protein MAM_00599 [Metarhizium album ARSEF 1941]|uniref:Uncharacterized protein n=1 Tax=Metarhizium album (strain ARSEF 1941) TaxID=1081103 RepID=A0A0B2X751_METAS|nr:uncharacterized protein MAM_00599 [Metarhizium album ARSEF 1941]KHO01598.1 hypothetical protein MAM_00599 [Metarhizium album ARSEF 1941]
MPRRTHAKRPVISAPIGPVRHLEGITFEGNDALRMVYRSNFSTANTNQSITTSSPIVSSDSLASRKSRRVSRSFPNTQPPSASPTVVESDISALSRIETNSSSKASVGKRPALLSLSTRSSSSRHLPKYTLVARPESAGNAADVPPLKGPNHDGDPSIPRSMSKWNTKTLAVLQELKKPFLRRSLAAVRGLSPDLPRPTQVVSKCRGSEPSVSGFRSSASTLATFVGISSRPNSPPNVSPGKKPSPRQCEAYWTGRFTALSDRFLNERLNNGAFSSSSSPTHNTRDQVQTRLPLPSRPSLASHDRLTYLAPSNTTSALPTAVHDPRPRPPDDQEILRQICEQLELECRTPAERNSFCEWKDTYYALKYVQTEPRAAEWTYDKGQKNGLLAGVGNRFKRGEVRRESSVRKLANSRSGAIGMTFGRGVAVY